MQYNTQMVSIINYTLGAKIMLILNSQKILSVTINNFNLQLKGMARQPNKNDFESVSSISVDPAMRDLGGSTIFGGRKSSFEYVNILRDSDQFSKKDLRNSLDILTSNINHEKQIVAPIRNIIQVYNDEVKVKIQRQGIEPLPIGDVISQSENGEQEINNQQKSTKLSADKLVKLETVYNQIHYPYHSYFPHDLATALKERQIPLQYVRGLLMARNLKQIKTTRRLKVERYLEKRRKKTWSRKICYNCRQKVAEQRLRIKGKFIKKRRAMEILGLRQPIDSNQLRQMLYEALKNKTSRQIDQIVRNQRSIKNEVKEQLNDGNMENQIKIPIKSEVKQQQ